MCTPISQPPTHPHQIRFPPSYRRRRGAEGDCGDYTDPSALMEAYSIYVKDKGGLKRIFTSSISALSTMATPASLPPAAAASLNETPRQSSGSSSINSASTGGTTTAAASDACAASGPSVVVGPSPTAERGRQRQHQSIRIPSYTGERGRRGGV